MHLYMTRKGTAVATASPVEQRARKAAWISLFTFGFGGFFYVEQWFYGLVYAGMMLFAFVTIFFGVGLILFPMFWVFGVPLTYFNVKRAAMERVLMRQADEAELRDKLAGGGRVRVVDGR